MQTPHRGVGLSKSAAAPIAPLRRGRGLWAEQTQALNRWHSAGPNTFSVAGAQGFAAAISNAE